MTDDSQQRGEYIYKGKEKCKGKVKLFLNLIKGVFFYKREVRFLFSFQANSFWFTSTEWFKVQVIQQYTQELETILINLPSKSFYHVRVHKPTVHSANQWAKLFYDTIWFYNVIKYINLSSMWFAGSARKQITSVWLFYRFTPNRFFSHSLIN